MIFNLHRSTKISLDSKSKMPKILPDRLCQALEEKWRIARGSNSKDEDQNLKMPEELVRFFKSLALEAVKSAHFVLFRFNEEHPKYPLVICYIAIEHGHL